MGKVTGTIYASIYLVLCGMVLAASFEAWTLTWALWALAALMLAVLCVFGYRLDSLASFEKVRDFQTESTVAPSHQHRYQEDKERTHFRRRIA